MIDLTTQYLGFTLRTPLVASASPLSYEVDDIKRMEDSGISAVVLYSLFEEQLEEESHDLHHYLTHGTESYAEALSYFPEPNEFDIGPEAYLDHIRKIKQSVDIPIVASLNGYTHGGWTQFAKLMEEAGADAIELNIYDVPTDADLSSEAMEKDYLKTLEGVKQSVSVPVSLKLSPYFNNLSHVAKKFDDIGIDALVLFNRFFQPDFDLDHLEVKPHMLLSTQHDMRLPLRWIALLYGNIQCDLAGTSGIHTSTDVLKMMMAGANIAMLCSVLIRDGIQQIEVIEKGIIHWMEEHEYESIKQMQGSMSRMKCHTPNEFERAQYRKALHSVHLPH